ncbi:MAG: hypothetical protein ACLQU1_01460 [Bryobacteraceae bacterium]
MNGFAPDGRSGVRSLYVRGSDLRRDQRARRLPSPEAQYLAVEDLVNDEYQEASGTLTISLATKMGGKVARAQKPFTVGALGQTTLHIDLDVPNTPGDFLLQAKADAGKGQPTLSRRNVAIEAAAGK